MCMRKSKEKKAVEIGLNRIQKVLEIDKFLRGQIKMKIAMKTLFSKAERFLIRNNRNFIISTDRDNQTNADKSRKMNQLEEFEFEAQNQRFIDLLSETGILEVDDDDPLQ